MRKKSGPGKPRFFEIVPQPSAMALHFLSPQFCCPTTHLEQSHENNEAHGDNSCTHRSVVPETCDDGDQNTTDDNQTHIAIHDMAIEKGSHGNVSEEIRGSKLPTKGVDALCVMVPETSDNGGQNATGGKQTPNAMDGMAIEEDSRGKVPENILRPKVCSEIDWSEKEVCIKCDEGGKLLVCSNSNCPLAVHEECMRCSAHFDSKGNFFCPYCSYKQVVLATRKAKKKAMLAKKALSVFLDRRKLEENVDGVKSGELNLPKNKGVDNRCGGIQENHPEERSGRESRTSVVPCVGATSSAVNEKNNVIGKCVDSGRSINGRGETANQTVTEQASDREETPKSVDDFQNDVWHDQEEAVIKKRRKLSVEPEKSVEGTLDDGETGAEEENPKTVDGFQNKRVERYDQETSVIGKNSNIRNEPDESTEESLDYTETEEEENPKTVDKSQNKRVEQHDQETSMMGKDPTLGVGPEESMEESLDDAETDEEENPKIVDNSQNNRVEQDYQVTSVIRKNRKVGVEPEESMEESIDDAENEEEENPKIVDDSQNKRMEGHDLEASAIGKDSMLSVEPEKSLEENLENAGIEKEKNGQESSGEDYMNEHDEVASDSSDGVTKVVLKSSRRLGKKNHNINSTNGECSRQTTRNLSFEGDGNKVQKEKNKTRIKSRQPITSTGFPIAKRKRVPWTAEEEEMLKEGVGRFSSTANKNLPWKKILDFGRHVFHGTRTADNLKDKWRHQAR